MKNQHYTLAIAVCLASLAGCDSQTERIAGSPPDGEGPSFAASVIPPTARIFGKTYGQWSAAWWQWSYGQPVSSNPTFDETGALCGNGQSGRVWFLTGVFNVSGTAVRDQCVIPVDKAIFFPVLNAECSNAELNGTTPDELRACAKGLLDLASNLSAEVDGVAVPNLDRFRVKSPPFNFVLPDDNLLQLFGFDAPAGSCLPNGNACDPYLSVGHGVYVMLAPISAGAHTIHFHGEIPAFAFALDITYHLTVAAR